MVARSRIRRAAKLAGLDCDPKRSPSPSRHSREATTRISPRVGGRSSQMQAVIAGYNEGDGAAWVEAIWFILLSETSFRCGPSKSCGCLRQARPAIQRGTAAITANANAMFRNWLCGNLPPKASTRRARTADAVHSGCRTSLNRSQSNQQKRAAATKLPATSPIASATIRIVCIVPTPFWALMYRSTIYVQAGNGSCHDRQ